MAQTQLDPTKVVIGPVRLGFVHLLEPFAFEGDKEAKYGCTILIPKSDKKTLEKIRKAQAAAVEKGIAKKWGGKKPARLGNTLRDGDTDAPGAGGEEFEGHYFMNVSTKDKPHVVDGAVQPIMDATEVYSGMFANVSLNTFPYATAGNNGISASLNSVQKVRDGESLGGSRSRAEDDFDALDDTADEEALNALLGL